jgi:hypothetical protein
MMLTIQGKYGIKATILADSISEMGVRFLTYEIEYPRLILAELNTHKMLSKNSFSSRAVPFNKMVQQLNGRPVRFGANQGGMQDKGEDFDAMVIIPEYLYDALAQYLLQELDGMLTVEDLKEISGDGTAQMTAFGAWNFHRFLSVGIAGALNDAKYHKQVFNRLTEAHQMMKTVISGTELENFFWLRDHGAADPSLHELARVMNEARKASTPELLKAGEWHLPYLDWFRGDKEEQMFFLPSENADDVGDITILTLEEAIKVSCARCAAVSYRNEGYGLEKSLEVYDRLVGDEKKHASAFEHCATPIRKHGYYQSSIRPSKYEQNHPWVPYTWEEGITHVTRDGNLWSGNLKGWRQYRKLIPGENYTGSEK